MALKVEKVKYEQLHQDCLVMGVLNITPDSFYEASRCLDLNEASEKAWRMFNEGAKILDVGAQSSRPGSKPIGFDEEKKRLWPLLEKLKQDNFPLTISLDTFDPNIANGALSDGLVDWINDIEGLRNTRMREVVATHRAVAVVMHMFETPSTMQHNYHYENVLNDLRQFFQSRLKELEPYDLKLILDPGIGFGKSVEDNLKIIANIDVFHSFDFPLLLGASRKSFIGAVLGQEPNERLEGSLAVASVSCLKGVNIIRTHDVGQTALSVKMCQTIKAHEQ